MKMPPLSDEHKSGFIRVKYELVYTADIQLDAYPDMTVDEAIAYELETDVVSIIEAITSSDGDGDDRLIVARNAEYITK
jgi:hypothetical protein